MPADPERPATPGARGEGGDRADGIDRIDHARGEPMGDDALRWARDPTVDARALLDALRAWPGVVDAVVTERHALVTFDPARPAVAPWEAERRARARHGSSPREHVIRVRYDGPDLAEAAARCAMAPDALAARHAAGSYVVRVVGFLPGFAYLGDVDAAIALPRRATPRARVPPLSVGIAARYTGVYPCASAGGWNLIGAAVDFAPFDDRGARLALGDRVRFEAAR